MRKKKICFYINSFVVGGIERVLLQYLKNIDKEKYEVFFLIGFDLEELEQLKTEIPKEIQVEYVLRDNIFCRLKKKKTIGNLKFYEKLCYEALSFSRKHIFWRELQQKIQKMDVIIDFDMTLAPYAKKIFQKRIAFCHFSPKKYHRGIASRQKKHGKRLAAYDKVVMISEDMKQEALEMYPFLYAHLVRFYNSFDQEELEKRSLEKISDSRIQQSYILAIGRLEETQKDFSTLLRAYARIEKEIEQKLYVIGIGRHQKQLEALSKELGIEKRVEFLGFQQNPYPWIRNADLFVHSSKFEGLPTVLIEALLFGKAIVATDCPTGPREILHDGENGMLTKLGDEKDLAQAMFKLLQDKNLQEQFRKEEEKSKVEFDSKFVMRAFEEMLDEI